MKVQTGITDQMRSLLEENGIDVARVTDLKVVQAEAGAPTEITVTLLALKQEPKA